MIHKQVSLHEGFKIGLYYHKNRLNGYSIKSKNDLQCISIYGELFYIKREISGPIQAKLESIYIKKKSSFYFVNSCILYTL